MSRHDDVAHLGHMLDNAREASALVSKKTRGELDSDRVLSLALVRLLEVMGEAATRVSAGARERHSAIPWQQIVGLRNRLIHGYDAVDMDVVWAIVAEDLPALIGQLETALAGGSPG